MSYELHRTAHVSIQVFDLRGRLVATLVDSSEGPGLHEVRWRGTSSSGAPVASGVYLVRFEANGVNEVRRAVLLK